MQICGMVSGQDEPALSHMRNDPSPKRYNMAGFSPVYTPVSGIWSWILSNPETDLQKHPDKSGEQDLAKNSICLN